jgi:2-polyprenyl-3-methyl-5-hydroxy-6-metoxy-1,4-benzoquinol methylase
MKSNKSSFILDHLCCVQCGHSLKKINSRLKCVFCSRSYPIKDGIPDLIIDEQPFRPSHFKLVEQYEQFGQKTTRKKNFSNAWRKKKTLELVEGRTVLEIGTAEGWLTRELVEQAETVVSCDISMSYLQRAQKAGIQAEFLRVDAHVLPFDQSLFDCIILTEVIEHVFSPFRVLEEIGRVMKPEGFLILSTPNNLSVSNVLRHVFKTESRNQDAHFSFYDPFALKQLLRLAGFDCLTLETTFYYWPFIKPLFCFGWLQNIVRTLNPYFGDKILVKARKQRTA